MKVELFKQSYQVYSNVSHKSISPINWRGDKKLASSDDWLNDEISFNQFNPPTSKHPLFIVEKTTKDEETYVENYGNPMYEITKYTTMIVVEKDGDKVALKFFSGYRHRRVGKTWFKISRNVDYISVNTRTGDVYCGFIHDYQNKVKCSKKIRRNYFGNDPINLMKSKIKNGLSIIVGNSNNDIVIQAISKFMFELDGREDFSDMDFTQRLFKFYLDKRQIKYPNNFDCYSKILVGPKIRKVLKKNGNKLVESFMLSEGLSGKKLKTALHTCKSLNVGLYRLAKDMFGDDWLNQDGDVITKLLGSNVEFNVNIPVEFKTLISNDELRRVYSIFKRVYIDGVMDSYSFQDHIRMYTELKLYGERDLRWLSENNRDEFRQEHLDWTDKTQFYKQGFYQRTYPQYFVDKIQNNIGEYSPVLLTNSSEYNEESSTQSNCVKTYIGKVSSFIISLRNESNYERATIEYNVTKQDDKVKIKRIQSLGRFNNKLGEEWNDVLFKLDDVVLSCLKDKRFKTVKIDKECKNGMKLTSDSYWDNNELKWSHKNIDGNTSIWQIF